MYFLIQYIWRIWCISNLHSIDYASKVDIQSCYHRHHSIGLASTGGILSILGNLQLTHDICHDVCHAISHDICNDICNDICQNPDMIFVKTFTRPKFLEQKWTLLQPPLYLYFVISISKSSSNRQPLKGAHSICTFYVHT